MNEKFAPELLESKAEIVECVMEQLEHMVRLSCLWTAEERKLNAFISKVKCGLIPRLFAWLSPTL